MALMLLCGVLVLAGLVAIARWGGREVVPPPREGPPDQSPTAGEAVQRFLWYLALAVVSGLGAGILMAGAGGRLVMRLLAATSDDSTQGRLTEADEIVGEITTGGTIGFIVFTALFFGVATGALYLLLRRWLPGGWWGGLSFGLLLLVIAATRLDPLRADNPDFEIVGPGWLSALVFGALVVAHGMLVAAVAGRYSRVMPLLSNDRRSLATHAPLLLLLPVVVVLIPVAVAGAAFVVITRRPDLVRSLRAPSVTIAGRVVLALTALVCLPGSVSAISDIVTA